MTIKEVLDRTTQFFKEKKFETSRLDAEILLSTALGLSRIELYLKFDSPLQEIELQKCRDLVRRRAQGEPVAYILGVKDFYGLSFQVVPGVLIPRPETEILVDEVVNYLKARKEEALSILDIGCGSGCIVLSLLSQLSQARATAVDLSDKALELTRINAQKLDLSDRVEILKCDGGQKLSQQFDVIVANPPYIANGDLNIQASVKEFEPHEALFSGDLGTEKIRDWFMAQNSQLSRRGIMVFEIGHDQGEFAKNLFTGSGSFKSVKIIKDLSEFDRHIVGIKEQ